MNKSFTLIEILVVIVIVGILSAFIIVSMAGVSSKAAIAKGQAFSNSIKNSLMMSLVSEWRLDDASGTTIQDQWGTNPGTWYGSGGGDYTSPSWRTSSECVSNGCLAFDGTDDYVGVSDSNALDITAKLTISIWIKALDISTINRGIIGKDGAGGYVLSLNYTSADSKISFVAPAVSSRKMNKSIDNQNWYYVVCVINESTNSLVFYLDGNFDSSTTTVGILAANDSNLFIGRRTNYFKGLMDDVRIYNAAIPTSQIQQNYYMGLNKLLKNNGIALNEFNERIVELKSNSANNN